MARITKVVGLGAGVAALIVAVVATVNGGRGVSVSIGVEPPGREQPAAPPDTLRAVLLRYSPGSGEVLVSNGIPLPPGRLFPDEAAQVRVLVGGEEQHVHSEPLHGLHADGSLRSVFVEFLHTARPGRGEAATIILGAPREVDDVAPPPGDRAIPEAVVLPDEASYLASTELAGPLVTRARTLRWGDVYRKYEQNFDRFADEHWRRGGDDWTENYYDRALIYYVFWMRTGDPEYFRRATLLAVDYREKYLVKNDYGSSPHWSQLEGLELHYLLTGDEASRTAVARTADRLHGFHKVLGDTLHTAWMESRIQARVLQSYLLAWQLQAEGRDWAALLDDGLTAVLGTQRRDGSYRFPNTCNESLNYMNGMLNDVYISIYRVYRPDPRIPPAVKRSLDFLWTQWDPSANAFRYISAPCTNASGMQVGGPVPAPDINNMIVSGFTWYGQLSGDATYRHRAELIFAGGVNGAYLTGTKQFNESYTTSWRHLSFRFPVDSGDTAR
ncbi:MAG TPA: hypothetical protein VFG84_03220 [Gemmatimonadaceae bacterium]|nr:hypothetical protein [Gemmatimonadaceae bacterium]